jgi:hypothetical protein
VKGMIRRGPGRENFQIKRRSSRGRLGKRWKYFIVQ